MSQPSTNKQTGERVQTGQGSKETGAARLRVLMITSEWPTPQYPAAVPFIVRQVNFVRAAGVEVDVFHFRGGKRFVNYVKAWGRLQGVLLRRQYDLVHAQFGQSALLPWPKRSPLVVTFRGCDLQGVKGPDGQTTRAGKLLRRLCQAVATRAEAVIVVSERMRRHLPATVTAHVIPSGLDLDALPCLPQEEARRRLQLPLGERLILFAGNPSDPVKRHDLAQKAVDLLQETLPARLIVVCGVDYGSIPLFMNACDVLLLTSRQEGSPNVVKEALACNLPVVSLDVGDVAARLHGVAGTEVCTDEAPETIAAALERVLRRGGRIRGRETVKDLDERLLTQKLLEIYHAVLASKDKARNRPPVPALSAAEPVSR